MAREYICHQCKDKIAGEEPTILQVGSLRKRFHAKCVCQHEKMQAEKRGLDEVYQYLKDILHYDKPLNKAQVQSIQALRAGTMLRRGTKVSLNKEGYPYEVILFAMKAKRVEIDKALLTKNFNDENAKTKYIMAIVGNAINDIYLRWINAKRQETKIEEKISRLDTSETELDYIKTPEKENDFTGLW